MAEIPINIKNALSDFITTLSKEIKVDSAFLFGSYAKGTWTNDSDIDIAVFSDFFSGRSRADAIAFLLDRALEYDLDIQPIVFDEKDLNNYQENPFVYEIITTGIKIA
ncbi:MAG: nucleotidyltransferase domain-containing protein [Desulfobacteria bacterium]|jgi:predicted nucleotidyltransferase|nr:nucleotidyltransferase domain-containing protein [Pseudomonadota bacterium]OEU58391.1 MAG: hypothetical protein BAW33_07965 [Desulfobacterales bacterium C00003104]